VDALRARLRRRPADGGGRGPRRAQRESGPKGHWYTVVFFAVVPDPDAVGPDCAFLPGRGEEVSDWAVRAGYQGDHDRLEDAVGEAKELAAGLPKSGLYPSPERLRAFLDQVTDPEDLGQTA
jgi:hypothetical protein